uniref:Uncharacterized protein n=1 Tax=Anguilla anguilla TaxID=7936 RepID=A0A0E9UHV1_ANGAN
MVTTGLALWPRLNNGSSV